MQAAPHRRDCPRRRHTPTHRQIPSRAPGVTSEDMKFSHHLWAVALSVMASSSMATEPSAPGELDAIQRASPQEAPHKAPAEIAASPPAPIQIYAPSAPCRAKTVRPGAKTIEIYWTNGTDGARVTTDEVDHYVELNVVVRTAGYRHGDCIEVTFHSSDGEDVAMGEKEIVVRGKVNESGIACFKEPLRNHTLWLRAHTPQSVYR